MKTVLITGINGYLGSSIAKAIQSEYHIIGLEYSPENTFRISNEDYKLYYTKDGFPEELFLQETIDIIIHTATIYGKNKESVNDMANANLFNAFELLNKAIENDCGLFINTDTVLERFVNLYALTKSQFRDWLYMRSSEIKVVNMKLEHFYGAGASNTNFISSMIHLLSENKESIDLTKGEQKRNFVYIDDIVEAYKIVLNKTDQLSDNYTDLEVCTNESISIKELMSLMKASLNSTTLLNFGALNYRNNELMESISDNSELIKLGWSPKYSISEGINKTIDKQES